MQIEKLEVPSPPTAEPEVQWREPPTIRRLEESVANRIAAGEVVQRPSSVVKELVENSLDAGATSISVVVKDSGLKLIQVSDNGHGIRYEDLPILCERHTTSKLTSFEDLQTIKSMGFRGEALASMTYVGHVTVMTITDGQLHGYRVSYRDGVMEHEPKPCAAVKGTQIMVENLFYNMLARRKALQNASDDYPKIVDLISRFAIYHTNVSFTCRKHGANKADVNTVIAASRLDAIKMVYGMPIARDLMEIGASDNNPTRSVFEMDGFISSANYMAKKTTMVLFINDRLVECTPLKRAIEVAYSATLTKASKPFIFMSIRVPSEHVDVNVHPTKREVPHCKLLENAIRLRRNPKEASDLTSIQELVRDIDSNVHSVFIFSSQMNTDLLMKKAELLEEYFSIHIDEQQNLTRLPVVLDQHTPDMDHVPEFLLSLGNDVVWTSEKECFQTIAAAIGDFYAMQPPVLPNPSGNGIQFYKNSKRDASTNAAIELKKPENVSDTDIDGELLAEAETAWAQREWTIQHVLFPSMRLFLKPPNAMAKNGTFVQVTSLDKLYKIFERC
ncbi:hypothetical protein KFK09_001081 [Dendrobium nobile]|uniref:DNA mismatch repair protein S5 domain-containing protein n=1 Tax=Dendrobium nobile TaxID=94219 RepID=A0A8T3C8P0_DENNO|nr:hypothetical protein KFK09_001081 [Dendrobium nobile]